jgi:hypothetical protein
MKIVLDASVAVAAARPSAPSHALSASGAVNRKGRRAGSTMALLSSGKFAIPLPRPGVMREGVRAGRGVFLARIPRKLYATASSPDCGLAER